MFYIDSSFSGYQQSIFVVKIGGREYQCSQAGSEPLKGITYVFGSHHHHRLVCIPNDSKGEPSQG